MKPLKKLTLSSLKHNRKRSIVTLIGIMLATAMLTAVPTMAMSAWKSLIFYEREKGGDYHSVFFNVPSDELEYIENNRKVDSAALVGEGTYAKLDNGINANKPYLYIIPYSTNAYERIAADLLEGRYPQKSGEITISKHIKSNGGVNYKIGDTITLNTGYRDVPREDESVIFEANQDLPYTEGETFITEGTATYTVVGITERPQYELEGFSAPGYTVYSYLDPDSYSQDYSVYAKYNKASDVFSGMADILGVSADEIKNNFLSGEMLKETPRYNFTYNTYLIKYETLSFSESIIKMLMSTASIVCIIIILVSVFCISNSFNISIMEKISSFNYCKCYSVYSTVLLHAACI